MSAATTFLNPGREEAFGAEGHVVVDLLHRADLRRLRRLVGARSMRRLIEDHGEALVFSDHLDDLAARRQVHRAVKGVVGARLHGILSDHRMVSGSFVVKQPGGGELAWHADHALTDERRYRSLSAWCPLVDLDEGNGALTVLVGSHQSVPPVRGGHEVQCAVFPSSRETLERCRRAGSTEERELRIRAGQAVIYDHRLAHRSPANASGRARVAVNVAAVPAGAPLLQFIRRDSGVVEVLDVPEYFFARHRPTADPGAVPGVQVREVLPPDKWSTVPTHG